jgi:hypothetical protein
MMMVEEEDIRVSDLNVSSQLMRSGTGGSKGGSKASGVLA